MQGGLKWEQGGEPPPRAPLTLTTECRTRRNVHSVEVQIHADIMQVGVNFSQGIIFRDTHRKHPYPYR